MDNKKFKPLKSVIFRNSFIICTAMVIVLIVLLNIVMPRYFFRTQEALNKDISVCINDNISEILSDVNYIYKELANDDLLVKNIIINQQAEKNRDYSNYNESHDVISNKLLQTAYCYKNVISKILIARDGNIPLNKTEETSEIEQFLDNKNVQKPLFVKLSANENKSENHMVFMPFYDKSGVYMCDMIFILSDSKNSVLTNQTGFVIADNNGNIMLSNKDDFFANNAIKEFLSEHLDKKDINYNDIQKIDSEEYFISASKIDDFAWGLFVFMPVSGFFDGMQRATVISIAIFVILLLVIYVYTGAFSTVIGCEISGATYEINQFLNNNPVRNVEKRFNRFVKKQLEGKNFYYKFMSYNITAVILPMTIGILFINVYYMYIINSEYKTCVNVLAEMNRFKIENIYDKYNNVMNYILINDEIKEKIYQNENLYKSDKDSIEFVRNYEALSDQLYNMEHYAGEYRFICQNNYNELFVQWPENETGRYDTTAFMSGFKIIFDGMQNKYICSMSRRVSLNSPYYFKKVGYCTLQFDAERLMENVTALNSGAGFGIVNTEGILVAASDKKSLKKDIVLDDKEYISTVQPAKSGDFSLFVKCSDNVINDTYAFIIQLSLIIICCMVALVFIISYRMSQCIIKPVKIVKKSLENDIGDFIVAGRDFRDEFDELNDAINEMKVRISTLIDDTYKYEIETKNLQMQSLRLQITPHFLYNIFEIINAMVDLKDERVGTLVLLMSDFFRCGISRNEAVVTLHDEIEYSNIYIDIQRFILENKLEFEQAIDERCMNSMVIRFIIQPVLENIFKHAMHRERNKIKIKLMINLLKGQDIDKIKIVIRDNGTGMRSEQLERLRKHINSSDDSKDGGVGLKNINQRLILHYGEEYKLRIYSVENKGTAIVIKIPCGTEE